jgi:hypothetical protein
MSDEISLFMSERFVLVESFVRSMSRCLILSRMCSGSNLCLLFIFPFGLCFLSA